MKRLLVAGLLMLAAVGCERADSASCWPEGQAPTTAVSADCMEVAKANNDFALRMYAQVAAKEKEGNFFFSPGSVHAALTMTYAGARGETAKQMATTLGLVGGEWTNERIAGACREMLLRLKPVPGSGYTLFVANALWGQKGTAWEPGFIALTRDNYGAGLRDVDFKGDGGLACEQVNDWVSGNTNRRITKLVSPGDVDDLTRMVLTNAIYFKGEWVSRFTAGETKKEEFNITPDNSVKVPMMHQEGTLLLGWREGFKTLKMLYAGDELSMVVILPDEKGGLAELEKALPEVIKKADLDHMGRHGVDVWLPKFKMRSAFSLKDTLTSMGMRDAFGEKADLTGIAVTNPPLYIDKVLHQTFVEVNEEGTEAAAATAVVVTTLGAGVNTKIPFPVFRADHPFMFLIRHEATGAILFMGRVTDPTKE